MAGLFVWTLYGDVTLFVLSIVAEMTIYFSIVLDEKSLVNPPLVSWQSRPIWALALLGGVFVAEFFMGGVLDIAGGRERATLPACLRPSERSRALTVVAAAFYDFVIGVGEHHGLVLVPRNDGDRDGRSRGLQDQVREGDGDEDQARPGASRPTHSTLSGSLPTSSWEACRRYRG